MKEAVNAINSFEIITSVNDKYYLFKSLLSFLNPIETIKIFDFKYDNFKIKLISEKIIGDLRLTVLEEHFLLFDTLLDSSSKLDYWRNQRVMELLFEVSHFMQPSQTKRLIIYCLTSKYIKNQKRAYSYLIENWDNSYSKPLIQSWKEFENENALELIIKKLPVEYLTIILRSLLPYFSDDDIDFPLKVLRNVLYARLSKVFSSEIKKLKKDDPISYIYVKKEMRRKVEKRYAIGIYKQYPRSRRYLPRWYSEMGMLNVLLMLKKFKSKHY